MEGARENYGSYRVWLHAFSFSLAYARQLPPGGSLSVRGSPRELRLVQSPTARTLFSLPPGGRGTACGGRSPRELWLVQSPAARTLLHPPSSGAPSRREPFGKTEGARENYGSYKARLHAFSFSLAYARQLPPGGSLSVGGSLSAGALISTSFYILIKQLFRAII